MSQPAVPCDGDDPSCEFLRLIASPWSSSLYNTAFAASLISSAALTLAIALIFCLLRPFNTDVYAPRSKYTDSKHAPPPVNKGLFDWIPPLIRVSEQEMVETVGLDAALFMRFTHMLRTLFLALSVVGCGILIPVNLLAANSTANGVTFFLRLTPQYMYGQRAFWAYVVVAYLFNFIICASLWVNYRAVLRLRRAYFEDSDYQRSLHARTLLLTDIPKDRRTDDGIVRLTESIPVPADHPPRAAIARNVKDLPDMIHEHDKTVRELESILAKYLKNPDRLPSKRPTIKAKDGGSSRQVDAIDYLTTRIAELEKNIKGVRESVDMRNALSYGFASYATIGEAHAKAYAARSNGPEGTIVRLAPRPTALVWKNLPLLKSERRRRNIVNNLWVSVLTLLWVIPNVLIAVFLSNLAHLGLLWKAFQTSLFAHPTWWGIVQGILSPALTTAFYYFLPAIFRKLCVNAGDVTKTSRERHVMQKLYSFFVFNNFIVFSVFSCIFGYVAAIAKASREGGNVWKAMEQQHPLNTIVITLCQISPYWVSWLLQRNIGTAVDLSQALRLFQASIYRRFFSPTPRELIEMSAPQPFDYAGYYHYFLFYSTVAVSVGVLQPLALPVTALYFFIDSFLKKYLLLYVFITKYESGGMFWRALFNRMLVCTFLGNVVVALLVATQGAGQGANWSMLAAMGPLPLLLIAFKIYCRHTYDDAIHYYQKGKMAGETDGEGRKRKGDRVGFRFGHPVLYKPLITPMVSAKAKYILRDIYRGRTSADGEMLASSYNDVYLDAMDSRQPGQAAGRVQMNTPFEIVAEHEMDYEHQKYRPEFGGREDSMSILTSTLTRDSEDSLSQSRSASRHRPQPARRTNTDASGGETEYPIGYHTPALRDQSPDSSDWRLIGGAVREQSSREGLVSREGLMRADSYAISEEDCDRKERWR
ncbi:DUF221-domain-containing protein [Piedraia hortae CBS 480.64]|uniref:DUF221-domain-containing protein n=1 Tax=Piedraia hortae CBS 480.64 TaxID=1314780 RepID=A0A6A7C8R2_9PEZI|nr:DUF221-domain-containing protein [Piedraia hortae CBS 480.64]